MPNLVLYAADKNKGEIDMSKVAGFHVLAAAVAIAGCGTMSSAGGALASPVISMMSRCCGNTAELLSAAATALLLLLSAGENLLLRSCP